MEGSGRDDDEGLAENHTISPEVAASGMTEANFIKCSWWW